MKPCNPESTVVGVAGCGSMGLPMARALHHAGFTTWGFDVRHAAEFGDFAPRMVQGAHEFAKRCDVIITVVRDAAQTHDLLFDQQGLFAGECKAHTLIVSSTLSPRILPVLRERLPKQVALIDAPMSGAPIAAIERRLSFMLGGEAGDIARCKPLIEAMGRDIFHVGKLGAGLTAKVFNNLVAASSVVATRHALAQAARAGIDQDTMRAVLYASSGQTWFGSNFDKISWAHEGYAPDNTIAIVMKDISCAADALEDGAACKAYIAELTEQLRALAPVG